jgi:hypothetical protein
MLGLLNNPPLPTPHSPNTFPKHFPLSEVLAELVPAAEQDVLLPGAPQWQFLWSLPGSALDSRRWCLSQLVDYRTEGRGWRGGGRVWGHEWREEVHAEAWI